MNNYSDNYRSAKENYLKALKMSYRDWVTKFHNRFGSWVIRLFGNETACLNIWSKGWDKFVDVECVRINLNGVYGCIYICEEENSFYRNQRSQRDNECDWYECNPEFSADPIGNYETLIDLMKEKLKEYGAIPPRKN